MRLDLIFTLSLMFFGSVLVNSLRYKYIHTYLHTYVGFELGFDHWGTICALSKNFGGHFYFQGDRQINFHSTFFFFLHSYRQAKKNIFFYLINKILYFPRSVLACNFCTEIKLFVCASFLVFSQNFKGEKIVPLAVFLRDNFNCSVGLAKWCSLAQILYLCIYNYMYIHLF